MPCYTSKRVKPSQSSTEIIEIRPSRYLRIQHLNPRPRNADFNREMALFIQYKNNGIPSSGPLTMPRRYTKNVKRQGKAKDTQIQQNHPLAANQTNITQNGGTGDTNPNQIIHTTSEVLQDKENYIPSLPASKSNSILSSPCHYKDSDQIHSASSVQVAMHNIKRLTESKSKSNNAESSIMSETQVFEIHDSHTKTSQSKCKNEILQSPSSPLSIAESSNVTAFKAGLFTEKISDMNDDSNKDAPSDVKVSVSDLVIFFIHGVGGSSDIWCAQIQHFVRQGYEVVAPDLIGHGFSCCPKSAHAYHFKEIAADIEEMFDRYCKKKNIVIGHSYGASFATLLARNRSRRVHKLVLISGGPPTPLAPQPGVFNLPVCMLGCIKPCLICGFKKGAFHSKRKSVISKTEAFNIPTYVLQHTMNGQVWADGDELFHNWLTCPTLLIYGADDKLVTLDDELHMEEAIFTSNLVVINEASHMVMIEAPDEVNELLFNFIQHNPEARTARGNDNSSHQQCTQQPHSSHQKPEIGLKRSLSRLSQKSVKSQRFVPHKFHHKIG